MENYSSQVFKHAGRKYTFTMQIGIKDSTGKIVGNYISNENIHMFQYQNELNKMFLTGETIIQDKFGVVDKYIEKQFVFLQVQNIQHESKTDGDVEIDKLSTTNIFQEELFVTSIQIVERQNHVITYRIKFVSSNWFNLNRHVSYTNYNTDPIEMVSIIKSLLTNSQITFSKATFDKVVSSVKLNYATKSNDTVLTAISYLLNKLYYYPQKDTSLKFLVYNETTHQIQLFDLANGTIHNGTTTAIVSLFKTQTEVQSQSEPISIGTVVKFPKTDTFKTIITHPMTSYSLADNCFEDETITSTELVAYKNSAPNTIDGEVYSKKYADFTTTATYQDCGTYWNNDLHVYEDTITALNQDNSLVINVDAEILRKPAAYVLVNVDRDDTNFVESEDVEQLNQMKEKYKGFEGIWFVSSVRHIISPSKGLYKQNLVLFRNFVEK